MTEPRKYALTKVQPGEYLCPANDGRLLWRFVRYQEDGSAIGGVPERPITGWFWSAEFTPLPESGYFDYSLAQWTMWNYMLPTRSDAIAEMLTHSEQLASR